MKTAREIKEKYQSITKETCEGYQDEHILQAMEEHAKQVPLIKSIRVKLIPCLVGIKKDGSFIDASERLAEINAIYGDNLIYRMAFHYTEESFIGSINEAIQKTINDIIDTCDEDKSR